MASQKGGSEPPSHSPVIPKDTMDFEPHFEIGGEGTSSAPKIDPPGRPEVGESSSIRKPGQVIPKMVDCPELVIQSDLVAKKTQYFKDHALIGKFLGFWPTERALIGWIKAVWKPKGHYDLQLGAKGFFTIVFFNLEDRTRVFENGPYFFNSAGLFLRVWRERFSPETEDLSIAPVWVRLFSLPAEFWDPSILEDIGNSIGIFVKMAEQTKLARYTSFARICVYMNISKDLPEAIKLTWQDEVWVQPLDYENLPFRCKICHEHGHLLRNYPLNPTLRASPPKENKEEGGFTKVASRKKNQKKSHPKPAQPKTANNNRFEALSTLSGEGPSDHPEKPIDPIQEDPRADAFPNGPPDISVPREEEVEDMEIGDLDLDAIEKAMADKDKGYVPADQVKLLEKAILMSKPSLPMGIESGTGKDNKRKQPESGEKRGRKSNRQRIAEVGSRLIESGQYPTIKDALTSIRKST